MKNKGCGGITVVFLLKFFRDYQIELSNYYSEKTKEKFENSKKKGLV